MQREWGREREGEVALYLCRLSEWEHVYIHNYYQCLLHVFCIVGDGVILAPLSIEEFPRHCTTMHENLNHPFSEEFQARNS